MSAGEVTSAGDIPLTASTSVAQASSTADSDRAFEDSIAPLVPLLLRYFTRRVTSPDDAADCTSETLLALWRHQRRLPSNVDERRAWAYGIARKVLANHHRGRARHAKVDLALRAAAALPIAPIPDEAFIATEALKLLNDRDQELIRLIIWEDLSLADAARVLGIRAGTARTRYSRALTRLRNNYATLEQS